VRFRGQAGVNLLCVVSIFKPNDIRGRFPDELDVRQCRRLARAAALLAGGRNTFVLGRDARTSSPAIHEAVRESLLEASASVIDLDVAPAPACYFAQGVFNAGSALIVTASHNSPECNGLKLVLGARPVVAGEMEVLQNILQDACIDKPMEGYLRGHYRRADVWPHYLEWLKNRFTELEYSARQQDFHIIFDAGHSPYGPVANRLLEEFGLRVTTLNESLDGSFPGRSPDCCARGALGALEQAVRDADAQMGFAVDADGDRVVFVDETGKPIPPDDMMVVILETVFGSFDGDEIIYDVKCSDVVPRTIEQLGGRPVRERSGYSYAKVRMSRDGCTFGGEASGHYFYQELNGHEDPIYTALSVAKVLLETKRKLSDLVALVPRHFTTDDIRLDMSAADAREIIHEASSCHEEGKTRLANGLRVDFPNGWALLRYSTTEPKLTLRFEADAAEHLEDVMKRFVQPVPALSEKVEHWLAENTQEP